MVSSPKVRVVAALVGGLGCRDGSRLVVPSVPRTGTGAPGRGGCDAGGQQTVLGLVRSVHAGLFEPRGESRCISLSFLSARVTLVSAACDATCGAMMPAAPARLRVAEALATAARRALAMMLSCCESGAWPAPLCRGPEHAPDMVHATPPPRGLQLYGCGLRTLLSTGGAHPTVHDLC